MKQFTKKEQRDMYKIYELNLFGNFGNRINLLSMTDCGCPNQLEIWLEAYDELDNYILKYMEESLQKELLDRVQEKRDIMLGKKVKEEVYKPLTVERKIYDIETLKNEIQECGILIDTINYLTRTL